MIMYETEAHIHHSCHVLKHPDPMKQFLMKVDASENGVGAPCVLQLIILHAVSLRTHYTLDRLDTSILQHPSCFINTGNSDEEITKEQPVSILSDTVALSTECMFHCDSEHSLKHGHTPLPVWDKFLPWAEYSQNLFCQTANDVFPFQCVLGYQPPLFTCDASPTEIFKILYLSHV